MTSTPARPAITWHTPLEQPGDTRGSAAGGRDRLPVGRCLTLTTISRRSAPERIDTAHRAATRARVIGERVTPETADVWIAAWDAKAATEGLERGAAYRDAGWAWITEQRQSRRLAPGSAATG